jgi:MFS family permease
MALNIGMFIGPFLSGLLYSWLHYFGIFAFISALLCLGFILLLVNLPKRFHNDIKDKHEHNELN